MSDLRLRVSWIVLAAVAAVTLAVGSLGDRAPRTEAERVREIAAGVRCPTCKGLSAADSDAIAAQAVRDAIRDGIRDGRGDDQIRAFLVSRFGDEILLTPEATGVSSLVWILPVAGVVVAGAALAATFRRWRREQEVPAPSEDDRRLVESALRR
ncbi:MAG TPA: cytochrome c-type biogenesis protein CcmH [Acidimicrobiales bacterium]|nr:cytochrome c-type biogenesis protein CcmH [Acidimicrobiales bacterium]